MCITYLFCICMWGAVGVLTLLPAFGRPEDSLRESVLSSLCNYMLFYLNVHAYTQTHIRTNSGTHIQTHILSYIWRHIGTLYISPYWYGDIGTFAFIYFLGF